MQIKRIITITGRRCSLLRDSRGASDKIVNHTPLNIAAKQAILKRRFFQIKSPQCDKDVLKIDLFKIKYEKIKKKRSPTACYANILKKHGNCNEKHLTSTREKLRLSSSNADTKLVIYKILSNPTNQILSSNHDKYSIE